MSQEEFDNRLRSSFQDEFIPPKDQLWVNISEKLEQKSNKPLWYWVLPILIVIGASLIWLANGLNKANVQSNIAESTSKASNNSPSVKEELNVQKIQIDPSEIKINVNKELLNTEINHSKMNTKGNSKVTDLKASTNISRNIDKQSNTTKLINRKNGLNNFFNTNVNSNSLLKSEQLTGEKIISSFEASIRFLNYISFPDFCPEINSDNEPFSIFEKENKLKPINKKSNTAKHALADMASKRWLSFGIGPQIALNTLNINNDSQAYIHKHLWENKDMITHNGTGINSFVSFNYKFGKNNRFSFETGLNYSLRTEDIKFNESTNEIAARDNKNVISQYLKLIVWIAIPKDPGPGYDTTFFNAVQAFTMGVKNKYSILTIPVRFNSEHKISENTFLSFGIGGGVSMMSAKRSVHYDLVNEKEMKTMNERQFSASLNSMLSVYTNFNDLGQIGLYSGFQTYLQAWNVQNKQYSIQMRDIQFGISFRKPL